MNLKLTELIYNYKNQESNKYYYINFENQPKIEM